MNAAQAQEDIRRIVAADDGRVFLSDHAGIRNPAIGKHPLTKQEILGVLATGLIDEGPSPDLKVPNGWKFRMRKSREKQTFYVVGVLVPETRVLVITGYEDKSNRRVAQPRRPGGIGGDGRDTE
jgi:hypothetical protein